MQLYHDHRDHAHGRDRDRDRGVHYHAHDHDGRDCEYLRKDCVHGYARLIHRQQQEFSFE